MQKNKLGNSDLWVTEIGFGCMSIGVEQSSGTRLIHEALDQGINFLDTADLYDRGRNEEIVGEALRGRRQDVILATKVGNRWRENGDGWDWDPSKKYILEAVKSSLKRLKTDYIDLYQLHGGTLDDPIDETIEAFEELKKAGLIRYYGISSIRPNVIREYVRQSNIVSVLTQYSVLDRRPEEEVLPLLKENNIHVIARGPIAKGYLTDKATKAELTKGYQDYTVEEIKSVLDHLESLTSETRSPAQLAIQYVLADPAVATVIPGASRVEQLLENVDAAKSPALTKQEWDFIRQHTKANVYESHR